MTNEDLIKEIDGLQDSIEKCSSDTELNMIYDKFGPTTVEYSNGEKKVFDPHYWVCFGKQIIKNLKVEVIRNG
jgi:hypothetical protein